MDGLTSPEGVAGGEVGCPAESLTGQDRRAGVSWQGEKKSDETEKAVPGNQPVHVSCSALMEMICHTVVDKQASAN